MAKSPKNATKDKKNPKDKKNATKDKKNPKVTDNDLLKCSQNVLRYSYQSVSRFRDRKNQSEKNNFDTIVEGTLDLTCIKKTPKGEMLFDLQITSVKVSARNKEQKVNKDDFSAISHFTLTKNGEVVNVWTKNKEKANIAAFKKGLIAQFQTQIQGNQRLQKTQDGTFTVHYEKKREKNGDLLIRAFKDEKDLVKTADPKEKKKDTSGHSKKFTTIDTKEGVIKKIVQEQLSKVGSNRGTSKNVKFEKGGAFKGLGNIIVFNVRTVVELMQKVEKKGHHQKIANKPTHPKNKASKRVLELMENTEAFEKLINNRYPGYKQTDLGLDKKLIKQADKKFKKQLDKSVDFNGLLKKLLANPNDLNTFASAQQYVKLFKKKSFETIQYYLNKYVHKKINFIRLLTSLLATIGNNDSQEILIHLVEVKEYTQNIFIDLMHIKKPSRRTVETLKKFAQTHKDSRIKKNSHLVLAKLASVLENTESKNEILDFLVSSMKTSSVDDLEFHLHSLSNAGEAVSLDIIQDVLNSNIHLDGKLIAVRSLENRLSLENNEKTNEFIHSVLSSKNIEEAIKVEAVKAQTKREHVLETKSSLQEMKKLLLHEESSEILQSAVHNYFNEVGVSPLSVQVNDQKTDAENDSFWSDLSKQFSQAQFETKKKCIKVNNNDGDICLYDDDLIGFVRQQGNLATYQTSRQVSFEKLLGSNLLHVYVGAVGYGGVKNPNADSVFDANFFGRTDFFAKIFSRKADLISFRIQFASTKLGIKNNLYLSAGGGVITNEPFMNNQDSVNTCQDGSTKIIEKSFENLLSFDFFFVVGVVPVKLGVSATAALGADMSFIVCPGKNIISLSIDPYFTTGVKADAAVTILLAEGGVSVSASINYRISKRLAFRDGLCSSLSHKVVPLTILVEGYLSFLFVKWSKEIYKYATNESLDGVIVDKPAGCTQRLIGLPKPSNSKTVKVKIGGFSK